MQPDRLLLDELGLDLDLDHIAQTRSRQESLAEFGPVQDSHGLAAQQGQAASLDAVFAGTGSRRSPCSERSGAPWTIV